MRILTAHYRYFASAGAGRYLFNVTNALETRGHEVIPFSIQYTLNKPTPYSKYFVRPLGREHEVLFSEQRMTLQSLWRTLSRLFYARDVERAAYRLASDTRPDIAYVLLYLRKLSPSLLVGLRKAGLPIVVRLSDFDMVCPEVHCLRDGLPCELCVGGNLWPSIRYRCVKKSYPASILNAFATWFHRYKRFFDYIDAFVTTTRFMFDMMLSAGYPEHRLRLIPTFVDGDVFRPGPNSNEREGIVYTGRLAPSKGLHVLFEAVDILRRKRPDLALNVKLAGWKSDHGDHLERIVRERGLQDIVRFVGPLDTNELKIFLAKAKLFVLPSLSYENLPNSLLESLASGTPVIASDIGSLAESIQDGKTGFLVKPGDAQALARRIEHCLDHPHEVAAMSVGARHAAETVYSPRHHIGDLERLFTELADENQKALSGLSLAQG